MTVRFLCGRARLGSVVAFAVRSGLSHPLGRVRTVAWAEHEPGLGSPVNPGDPVTERRKTTATTAFGVGRRKPRRIRFLRALHAPRNQHRRHGQHRARGSCADPQPQQSRDRRGLPDEFRGARRHLSAVFRGQGIRTRRHGRSRYPQRCAKRSGVLPRVSPDVARRLQGVRRGPRTRRTHRGQRRQSRPEALPLAERRRHLDPARRPRSAVAGRDHLAEGGGRHRFGRLGQLPQGHQPGAA